MKLIDSSKIQHYRLCTRESYHIYMLLLSVKWNGLYSLCFYSQDKCCLESYSVNICWMDIFGDTHRFILVECKRICSLIDVGVQRKANCKPQESIYTYIVQRSRILFWAIFYSGLCFLVCLFGLGG